MKVLVTGVSGQLGFDTAKELETRGIDFLGTTSADLDVRDRDAVFGTMRLYRPDAVIHCAAYTKVDAAEEEEALCRGVNVDGTRHIAEACAEQNAKLLYISTDYVFPGTGDKPWETSDPTGPLNIYGKSKLDGELIVRELVEKYCIIRTSWVIGEHGSNFVKTMLRLAEPHRQLRVVDDQIGSPTFTADLAPLLCDMAQSERCGLYHATTEGFCSWADLAEAVFLGSGKNTAVCRVSTEEYGARAPRPKNARLSKIALDRDGFPRLPSWESSLTGYLRVLGIKG